MLSKTIKAKLEEITEKKKEMGKQEVPVLVPISK